MEVETGVMQPQTRATSGHQELEVVGRSLQRQRGRGQLTAGSRCLWNWERTNLSIPKPLGIMIC